MKKIMMLLVMLMSINIFANQGVELEKEVTGEDRQVLEQVDGVTTLDPLQGGTIDVEAVELDTTNTTVDTVTVTQDVQADDGLEDELNKKLASDKAWWKYALGGLLLILGAAGL